MNSDFKIAVLMPQPHCNMRCNFCITEDNFSAMTFTEAVQVLNFIHHLGINHIIIGGGEPLFWKEDVFNFASEAKKMGFFIQLGTNCINLPEGFELNNSIDRYVVPLESVRADIHNQMRFFKNNHHEIILKTLKKLKSAQKSVTISTVITRLNKDYVYELSDYIKEYNLNENHVHAWHLYQFLPMGRGGSVHRDELLVEESEFNRIYQNVRKTFGDQIKLYKRKNMLNPQTVDFFWMTEGKIMRLSELTKKRGAS